MDEKRALLRHTVATVADRAARRCAGYRQALRRSAVTIRLARQRGSWRTSATSTTGRCRRRRAPRRGTTRHRSNGIARSSASTRRSSSSMHTWALDSPLAVSDQQLFQGAIADSLAHVGQLAILRRLGGAKMKSENYSKADIVAGRVGPDQTVPELPTDPGRNGRAAPPNRNRLLKNSTRNSVHVAFMRH